MEKILIIDGNALMHRGFHALPKLKTKDGRPTNAIYGFLSIFLKAVKELKPDFVCACFDLAAPTFRHKKFDGYKAHRPKTPDDLKVQFPGMKKVLRALEIPVFEKQGFEADDLIATISRKPMVEKIESIILSGDLDTLQLVDDNTKVYTPRRGVKDIILYNEEAVLERYGLPPALLVDYKGLVGDSSDNIPGVKGIGEKGATALIKSFGSLENIYQEIEDNTEKAKEISSSARKKLVENKEQAFFSKMLAQVKYNVPIDFDLEKCSFKNFKKEKAVKILEGLGFRSLINRLPGYKKEQNRLF